MPGHVSGDGLYEWILHEANRVLNFPSWPGRVIYLDAPSEIRGGGKDGGDYQVDRPINTKPLATGFRMRILVIQTPDPKP